MVLFIDDKICDAYKSSSCAKILEDSKLFIALIKEKELTNSDRVLYVAQHEYATISPSVNCQNFYHIASDAATTCIITVLVERSTKSVSLAHFDGRDTLKGISEMLEELMSVYSKSSLIHLEPRFDLYLFGGFLDSRNLSVNLFNEIIAACTHAKERIDLRLNVTLEINTTIKNKENWPIVYGVSVNITTMEFQVSSSNSCCPDFPLREARLMFSNNQSISGIYDLKDQCISISPFSFNAPRNFQQLLQLPDDKYLELMSTSPHCEPHDFVIRGKSTVQFLLEHQLEDVFNKKNRRYKLNAQCKWEMLDKEHKLIN